MHLRIVFAKFIVLTGCSESCLRRLYNEDLLNNQYILSREPEKALYRISKQFHFSAAHVLSQLPESHPCSRLHGHNYIVEVVLESETLDHNGFVVDYNALYPVKEYINARLDHRNLNDILPMATTAENIAKFLFDRFKSEFPALVKVRISETPKTWAEYEEP